MVCCDNLFSGLTTYHFALGDGQDTIEDYDDSATPVDVDSLLFSQGIEAENLWFSQVENNLQVNLLGTEDRVTILNWFESDQNQIESIQVDNGLSIGSNEINLLVEAMAAFNPPQSGEVSLTETEQNQINQSITSSWQIAG